MLGKTSTYLTRARRGKAWLRSKLNFSTEYIKPILLTPSYRLRVTHSAAIHSPYLDVIHT